MLDNPDYLAVIDVTCQALVEDQEHDVDHRSCIKVLVPVVHSQTEVSPRYDAL